MAKKEKNPQQAKIKKNKNMHYLAKQKKETNRLLMIHK